MVRFISLIFYLWMTHNFFSGVDLEHLCYLHCLFLCFEAVSCLKINLAKSKLVHAGHVSNVEGLAEILGCRVSSLPIKYQGLPLGAFFKAKSIWDGIIEKIEHCLVGWKRLYLLNGGVKGLLLQYPFLLDGCF